MANLEPAAPRAFTLPLKDNNNFIPI